MSWLDPETIKFIRLNSSGYVNPTNDSLDKTIAVTGNAGVTGELLAFDTSLSEWIVKVLTGTFTNNMALTIPGFTGAGTISSIVNNKSGDLRVIPFSVFYDSAVVIPLTGTVTRINISGVGLAELTPHSFNAEYIGIGADGRPDLGCVRPTTGLMYPRKI